jgi:hypothetical protein
VLGDRPPQSFGIDGLGIDQPLQPDPAELPEDGDRDLCGYTPPGARFSSGMSSARMPIKSTQCRPRTWVMTTSTPSQLRHRMTVPGPPA